MSTAAAVSVGAAGVATLHIVHHHGGLARISGEVGSVTLDPGEYRVVATFTDCHPLSLWLDTVQYLNPYRFPDGTLVDSGRRSANAVALDNPEIDPIDPFGPVHGTTTTTAEITVASRKTVWLKAPNGIAPEVDNRNCRVEATFAPQ